MPPHEAVALRDRRPREGQPPAISRRGFVLWTVSPIHPSGTPPRFPLRSAVRLSSGPYEFLELAHLESPDDVGYALHQRPDAGEDQQGEGLGCLLYTSPSPRDRTRSRMPSS